MAPQNFTTTAQYKESDHTLVTDEDNDEGFAPNREIGDGLECRMETIARVARILRKKNATSTTVAGSLWPQTITEGSTKFIAGLGGRAERGLPEPGATQ